MNENVEWTLDELERFRMAGEMTYAAYSRLYDLISELNDLLKEQEAVELVKWIYPSDIIGFGRCPYCNSLWDYSLISNRFFKHCPRCGQEVKSE